MISYILKNPFFLKEWWVWQREMPRWQLVGTRLLFFLLMMAPFVVICFAAMLFGSFSSHTLKFAWGMAAFLWLGGLSWFSVSSTIQVYHYERDLGTLQVVSLTRVHPFHEVLGRWAGSLVCVFEGWIMGLLLVLFSLFLLPESFINVACAWVFSAFWCAALGALGIACSAAYRTIIKSVTGLSAVLLMITAIGISLSGLFLAIITAASRSTHLLSWCLALPPDPLVFYLLFSTPFPPVLLVVLMMLWTAFIAMVLMLSAFFVARGFPLRGESSRHPGPRGIIPVADSTPVFADQGFMKDLLAPGKSGARPGVPRRSPADGFLNGIFHRNPFYMAYRRGFMRIYRGATASPGSLLPPALVICGQLCYCLMSFENASSEAALALVIALASASFISLCEALLLGNRALHAERDQSTWPMLLATGMRPGQVLAGKFAMTFYALSGEWSYTAPLWLLCALCGGKAGVLALAIVHPAVISLGILTGLWMASQPRFLILDLRKIGSVTASILIAWLLAYIFIDDFPLLLRSITKEWAVLLNPLRTILALGQCASMEELSRLISPLLGQGALFCVTMVLLWKSTMKRLGRVMEGE
jgi:hypothetical protein